MDELEISGKRYISSKRIAKENKYHSDYIGQLIRGGKILGTKVGRAWYVEERSFADYLNKESKTYVAPAPSTTPVQIVARAQPAISTRTDEGAPQSDGSRTEQISSRESAYPESVASATTFAQVQTIPIRKQEVFIPAEPVRTVPVKKTSLTYISDSSPLFPAIQKRSAEISRTATPVSIQAAPIQRPIVTIEETHIQKRNPFLTALAVTSVGVLGAVVLAFAFFGSLGLDTTVTVQKGQIASVSYSQEKTLCFIFGTCQNDQN
jgi:hypothetical protein